MNNKKYIETFFEEKGLAEIEWSITKDGLTHYLTNYNVIEWLKNMDNETLKPIREKLVLIDFRNGDINDFLKYLARPMIESWENSSILKG